MAKLLNIDAETNANIIDDGTDPTLSITNSSGSALDVNKLVVSSSATIADISMAAGDLTVNTLGVDGAILAANATVAAFDIRGASVASGAVLALTADAAVSLTTIDSTEGGVAGTYGMRIVLPDGTFGWVPIYPDAAITAAAVS